MKTVLASLALALLLAGIAVARPVEQRVPIAVTSKGFEPATIHLRAGAPVVLVVTRTTDRTCAKEIVIANRRIHAPLPLNRPVEIRLAAEKPGSLRFACGMGMVSGTLVVE